VTRIRRESDEVCEDLVRKSYVKECLRLILHDILAKASRTTAVNNDCRMPTSRQGVLRVTRNGYVLEIAKAISADAFAVVSASDASPGKSR